MDLPFHPFSEIILQWYSQNKRVLPWRNNKNPYSVWLSEIILQQTRIEQGLSYYLKFLEAFPKVEDLANADEDLVMSLWQGLGYYSRARNLHAAAKMVVNDFKGNFPDSYDDLRKLPGVGPYTASAIASISFQLPHAVVDGNVYRLLSRYFNISTPIDSGAGVRQFFELANELIPHSKPGDFNQAMMDFGSLVCKPANPKCVNCPLNAGCLGLKSKQVDMLPIKRGKTKVSKRYFVYLILKDDNLNTLVRKRGPKDIWEGLFEFPLIELQTEEEFNHFQDSLDYQEFISHQKADLLKIHKPVKHVLSHRHLFVVFAELACRKVKSFSSYEPKKYENLSKIGMPRVITRFLENE
ncbi:MAG: A/G-specific adenine glycosylase [Bacteroidia bacterium]